LGPTLFVNFGRWGVKRARTCLTAISGDFPEVRIGSKRHTSRIKICWPVAGKVKVIRVISFCLLATVSRNENTFASLAQPEGVRADLTASVAVNDPLWGRRSVSVDYQLNSLPM
jgi:hypothetical protein